jgi:hypothetical protein
MSTRTRFVRPWRGRTRERLSSPRGLVIVLLALVVAIPFGVLGVVAAPGPDAPSPAQGHAEVIAHGVVPLPSPQGAWRIESVSVPLPDKAQAATWPLGFALASKNAILLVDQATGDKTRLAAGEASLVRDQTSQTRSSLGTSAATYFALALQSASSSQPIASGSKLVFESDAFAVPQGDHDLDLVRDVLSKNTTGHIADQGAPVLVLATAGSLDVKSSANTTTHTLKSGEAQLLSGSLTITPAGSAGATYVAAVIGPEVKTPTTPTPTATPLPNGTAQATVMVCPAGYDAASASRESLKSDCDQPLEGVTIHYRTSGDNLPKATDSNGQAVFGDLLPNTIDLVEDVPSGYELTRVVCSFTYPAQPDGTPAASGDVDGTPDQGGLIGHDFRQAENLTCTFYDLPLPPASPTATATTAASPSAV